MKFHQNTITALVVCLLTISLPRPARAQTTAPAQLQNIIDKDAAARKAGDSVERLKGALQLDTLLNGSPAGILAVAHAYSVLKDSNKVFETMARYARTGVATKTICNGEDKKFAWLSSSPRFAQICRLIQQNASPVHNATTVINFPDSAYLAEDIDYDPQDSSFLFTSVLQHAAFRLTKNGKIRMFTYASNNSPMMAIKIDARRNLVWITEVAMPGFNGYPDTAKGRSILHCYELNTAIEKQKIEAPEGAQLADMVLDATGTPICCDGQSGAIYKLDGQSWQRLDKGDFISPQTPALTKDGKHLIVPDYERGIAIMEIATGAVGWLKNSPCALNGVDGVYLAGNILLLTQNGVEPERVLALPLEPAPGTTLATRPRVCRVIEKATPKLGEPTHGVIVGRYFYFIANAGWDALDAHGNLKPGSLLTPPRLMRYPIAAVTTD